MLSAATANSSCAFYYTATTFTAESLLVKFILTEKDSFREPESGVAEVDNVPVPNVQTHLAPVTVGTVKR